MAEWSGTGERRLANLDIATRRALILAGARVRIKAVEMQESERPHTIGTGQTIRSQSVSPVMRGSSEGMSYLFVRVGPRPKGAIWGIELGRSPGRIIPPVSAIKAWLRDKPGGVAMSESELTRAAYAVAVSIGRKGTPAYHIMSRALAEEKDGFTTLLRTSIMSMLSHGI